MMFVKALGAFALAAFMVTPASAWGSRPLQVKNARSFALSETVMSAVDSITTSVHAGSASAPSDAT